MKRLLLIVTLLIMFNNFAVAAPEVDFNLFTSSYAYNGENTHYYIPDDEINIISDKIILL